MFTLNNYTEEEEKAIAAIECRYVVYGREVGESGTPHLQGYIYFTNKKSRPQLSKLIPRAFLEAVKGTPEQAIQYCKKDGNFEERGTPPVSPKKKGENEKKRYQRAWELAKEGKFEEIDADIRVRHINKLQKIRSEFGPPPESIPELINEWYWGDTGAGKSRKAREENPRAYIKNPNKWWCGYRGEEVVIIDEWMPSHECLANHLKVWADHYPFRAESKGASKFIRPKKIIITSNYAPEQCFIRQEDLGPIRRRFKVTHFTNLQ